MRVPLQPKTLLPFSAELWTSGALSIDSLPTGPFREGNDIYTFRGGTRQRLTNTGLNENPEFSPDHKYIYFDCDRSGTMQIWRMRSDGGGQEQVTYDGMNNVFPHVSPDGQRIVFLSYEGSTKYQEKARAALRIMSLSDNSVKLLARFGGGRGSLSAPPWSPDGKQVVFISYQQVVSPQ